MNNSTLLLLSMIISINVYSINLNSIFLLSINDKIPITLQSECSNQSFQSNNIKKDLDFYIVDDLKWAYKIVILEKRTNKIFKFKNCQKFIFKSSKKYIDKAYKKIKLNNEEANRVKRIIKISDGITEQAVSFSLMKWDKKYSFQFQGDCTEESFSSNLITENQKILLVGENQWAFEIVIVNEDMSKLIIFEGCTSPIYKASKKYTEKAFKKITIDTHWNRKFNLLLDRYGINVLTIDDKSQSLTQLKKNDIIDMTQMKTLKNLKKYGINLTEPQSQSTDVYNDSLFINVFKNARPAKEFFRSYPDNGSDQKSRICVRKNSYFKTAIYQSAKKYNVYNGEYTLYFKGKFDLKTDGMGRIVKCTEGQYDVKSYSKYCLKIDTEVTANPLSGVGLTFINKDNKESCIEDIRVLIPGGYCEGNPFKRVNNVNDCELGKYISFTNDSFNNNSLTFNPDALAFLKKFKTLRFMNTIAASPRVPRGCEKLMQGTNYYNLTPEAENCLLSTMREWQSRAKLTDLTYGQSGVTDIKEWRGMPLELIVKLANLLEKSVWLVVPHNSSDEYISKMAELFVTRIKSNIDLKIEYSNEIWNGIFWGSKYLEQWSQKNEELKTINDRNTKTIAAYVDRSLNVFSIWNEVYEKYNQKKAEKRKTFKKIFATNQTSAQWTRLILSRLHQINKLDQIDYLATATYFYSCWGNENYGSCKNQLHLREAQTVDDVFNILLYKKNFKGIAGVLTQLMAQKKIISNYNHKNKLKIKLVSYEGGHHIVPHFKQNYFANTNYKEKSLELRKIFEKANAHPDMGKLYSLLIGIWQKIEGDDLVFFVAPQTNSRFGTFGLSESFLNTSEKLKSIFDEQVLDCGEVCTLSD